MDFYRHPRFKEFKEICESAHAKNINVILLSVPSMSVSYFIHKLIEDDRNDVYGMISEENQKMNKFSFIDFNFSTDSKAIEKTDKYLKSAELNQKSMIAIDNPYILTTEKFKKSYLSNHFYKIFYFKSLDLDLVEMFCKNMNSNLSDKEIADIYKLSGGISSIVKYLIANPELLKRKESEIISNTDFIKSISLTIEIIRKSRILYLENLGITKNGKLISTLLNKHFDANKIILSDIVVDKDLSFSEDGVLNNEKLLNIEKNIIEFSIGNDGIISKEQIAEAKWGKDSYDEYSDDAIIKTMLRLNKKLKKYKFISIPTLGYKLSK